MPLNDLERADLAAIIAKAKAEERAAIVAWLRTRFVGAYAGYDGYERLVAT